MAGKRTTTKLFNFMISLFFASMCLSAVANAGTLTIAKDVDGEESSTPINGQFVVKITPTDTTNDVTVSFAINNVSPNATEGDDYSTITPKEVVIPAGASSVPISIDVLPDDIIEATEKVNITITGWSGGSGHSIDSSNDTAEITITDDDSGTVSINATDASASESGDAGEFEVRLSDGAGTDMVASSDTVIDLSASGAAIEGTDYDTLPTSVTISAGTSSETFAITPKVDSIIEPSENVDVSISINSGDADISVGTASDTVNIENTDDASFSIDDVSQDEDSGDMVFTIDAGNTVEGTSVSVGYETTEIPTEAVAGTDYTAQSGSAEISSGSTTTITVPITPDTVVEKDETFTITLSNPSPASATIADAIAQGTIINDDVPVLTINDSTEDEGDSGVTDPGIEVTTNLAIAADAEVIFDYQVVHGTTTDDDFTGNLTNSISWSDAAADDTIAIPIEISPDTVVEYDEDYTVQLNNAIITGGTGIPNTSDIGIGQIRNDDSPTLTMITTSSADAEGADGNTPTASFTVQSDLTVASGVDVTFDYTVANTSAESTDLQTGTFSSSLTDGTNVDIPVTLTGDDIVEEDEEYTVTIANSDLANSSVGAQITSVAGEDTATGIITNDDIPTLTINDSSVYEGSTGTTDPGFLVTTDLEIAPDVTVDFDWSVIHDTTDDADFTTTPLNGSLSISGEPAGATVNVPLEIASDFDVEDDETYTVEITGGTISGTSGTWSFNESGSGEILNDEHTITMSAGEGTTISWDGGSEEVTNGDVEVTVARNATPTFTVAADTCYHLATVTAQGNTFNSFTNTDQTTSYTFIAVTQNETITGSRTIDRWTVTSQILGQENGTITGTGEYDGCTDPVYSVISDSEHHITYVDVDGSTVVGPHAAPFSDSDYDHTFTNINDDHTITATFTQSIGVIEDSPFGTINPDPGENNFVEVAYNATPDFDLTADDPCVNGHIHHISDIVVDGTSTGIGGIGTDTAYTYTYSSPVTADSIIEAQFTGWVDVTVNGPGEVRLEVDGVDQVVSGSGAIEYEADSDQVFQIIPDTGYHITDVLVDGADVGRVSEYIFNEEAPQDHELEVSFAINWYSIEASSTFNTIYDDSAENILASTKYPLFGANQSFYVDLNDPQHAIQAIFIDNTNVALPATNTTYTDPGGVFQLTNTNDDTLEVEFTNVTESHRLVVVDYDVTPISDVPLVATSITAPANIMFIIDDSGSMHWSTMVPGVAEGKYCVDGPGSTCDWGDRYTSVLEPGGQIPQSYRMQWKSQWAEYNRMYYNPSVSYVPWPRVVKISEAAGFDTRTAANADTVAPRFHPLDSSDVLMLSDTFATVATPGADTLLQDDHSATFNSSNWQNNGNSNAYNNDYYYAYGYANPKEATWTFQPNTDDIYDVYVSWSPNSSRQVIDYVIECDDCSTAVSDTISVDQSTNGLAYEGEPSHLLGSYAFEDGEDVTVTLVDTHGGYSTSSLDAVMLTSGRIRIPNAHYYIWSEEDGAPYLVTFDDTTSQIRYYRATGTDIDNTINNSDDVVTALEEKTGSDIPSDVVVTKSYDEALQNFANWVTYYRERRTAAIAGVSRAMVKMEGVQVGLSSLNSNNHVPVKKIKVDGEDYTDDLLETLYGWPASGGTPLRNALEEVGQYYENSDGNDWSQSYGSPYASEAEGGSCQQCFSILMTDGFYNGGGIGSYSDDNDNTGFTDADGDTLYASPYNDTLADIAMHFYENDLVSSLSNDVSTSPEETETFHDIATWQHMVTYTVSFGLTGTLNPDDYELRTTAPSPDYPAWPNPSANSPTTIDDLWHAAVNGRGKFLNATNPDDLVKSLIAIIENIGKRTGSAASVSINGDELYETIGSDIRMYQTSFNTSSWYGDLKSYKLVSDPSEAVNDGDGDGVFDTSEWSASSVMASTLYTNRNIFTYNGGGAQLTWANLSGLQQKSLTPYYLFPLSGTEPANIDDELVLEYLLGDATYEGYYRERTEPLGDFVNSQATFEDEVLYVGGNDGMLHAFDANNGSELFAYVPGLVYADLRELANPAYDHKFYVDSTPYVEKISNSLTLLVGGLGKGGKGYFALDVTTPASFDAGDVKWEYPEAPATLLANQTTITFSNPGGGNDVIYDSADGFTDAAFDAGNSVAVTGADCDGYSNNGTYQILAKNSNGELEIAPGSLVNGCGDGEPITITESIADTGMGYSFSDPVLVKTNDSSIGSGDLEGWVVIFGNGYASEDGTAQLYILNPADGTLIKKIDTGVGPANGMSTPKVIDVDNDLKADYVYAGDLLGNMWKFDLSGSSSSDWQVAYCDGGNQVSHCQATGAVAKPLFKGLSDQPITAAPDVMRHPTYSGYMVIYGTGKFLGTPDLESTHLQSFYGLWDWAPDEYDEGYLGERIDSLEDIDGDGRLDVDEDTNNNGVLDPGEDIDGDGNLDVDEDLNGNGVIDALTATVVSNSPTRDPGTDEPLNTLVRQEIIVENVLTEDTNGDGILDPDEDVDGDGEIDTYSYLRIPTSIAPDWHYDATIDVNHDGDLNDADKVPQNDIGWYFDLPGKITDNDSVDNDSDGVIDEDGERSLGERVTSDTIIRDGKAIMVSFGVTGSTCDVGMFSFLNERNARTGGSFGKPVLDINGDGIVNEMDLVIINYDDSGDVKGIPTDNAFEGRIFNPAILRDPENPEIEKKFMSSSSGNIQTQTETAERIGVYLWQQIE